jgi:hypothetical protein
MMSDKNTTLALASSLTVIPFTTMLVAIVLHERWRESSQTSGFLIQTRSRKQVANTITGIDRQQLRGKITKTTTGWLGKSRRQLW